MNIYTLINRKNTYSNISIDNDTNYDYNILKYKLNNIIKYYKNINKLNIYSNRI